MLDFGTDSDPQVSMSSLSIILQVKHPEVAQFLGGRLYDCVFKYNEVLS